MMVVNFTCQCSWPRLTRAGLAATQKWYHIRGQYQGARVALQTKVGSGHRCTSGVPKDKPRDAYFVWDEAHGPDVVIELTSKSTRDEDLDDKMSIYQDEMPVPEYFLFDPRGEYLDPPLQGHRLREGKYVPIEMVEGRLPSEVLGLHLERDGEWLRFYDPATGLWLPTPEELLLAEQAKRKRAEAEQKRAEAERKRAEAERKRAEAERKRAEAEGER